MSVCILYLCWRHESSVILEFLSNLVNQTETCTERETHLTAHDNCKRNHSNAVRQVLLTPRPVMR